MLCLLHSRRRDLYLTTCSLKIASDHRSPGQRDDLECNARRVVGRGSACQFALPLVCSTVSRHLPGHFSARPPSKKKCSKNEEILGPSETGILDGPLAPFLLILLIFFHPKFCNFRGKWRNNSTLPANCEFSTLPESI
jgi:hypothetical protein